MGPATPDSPGDGRPGDTDPRFTITLVLDVARVLIAHGYEPFTGDEHAALRDHLRQFLHHERRSPTADVNGKENPTDA